MTAMENGPAYRAWADGSCRWHDPAVGGSGAGGWAVVVDGPAGTLEAAGFLPDTTAIVAELTAAIEALRRIPEGASVELHLDHQPIVGIMTRTCRRRAHFDLYAELRALAGRRDVRWTWIKRRHNRADHLARRTASGA